MDEVLRIGELSRRSGVAPDLLRAWERRYGLLRPTRSSGGLRLYSLDDLDRVRRMRSHLDAGVAAAEAAALAVQAAAPARRGPEELAAALDAYDEPRAHATFDDLLAASTLESVLRDVVLPYLRRLGERWERGEATVAQEHFASAFLRGRLLGLARGWGRGVGPLALLACAPGEQHELGLLVFGLALRQRGWRVVYLGADTPLDTLHAAADELDPDVVVVSIVDPDCGAAVADRLRELAQARRLLVGGPGAVAVAGVGALAADPLLAADALAA